YDCSPPRSRTAKGLRPAPQPKKNVVLSYRRRIAIGLFGAVKHRFFPTFGTTGAVLHRAHQLPAGSVDVIAAGGAYRGQQAMVIKEFMELQDVFFPGALIASVGGGFEGKDRKRV